MHVLILRPYRKDNIYFRTIEEREKIINIYAPNNPSDRKRYIKHLSQYLDEEYSQIIAGDFNCVLNGMLDR